MMGDISPLTHTDFGSTVSDLLISTFLIFTLYLQR